MENHYMERFRELFLERFRELLSGTFSGTCSGTFSHAMMRPQPAISARAADIAATQILQSAQKTPLGLPGSPRQPKIRSRALERTATQGH